MAIEKLAYAFEKVMASPSGRRALAETGKALIPVAATAAQSVGLR